MVLGGYHNEMHFKKMTSYYVENSIKKERVCPWRQLGD